MKMGKLTQVQKNKVEHILLQCKSILEKWRSLVPKKDGKQLAMSMLSGKTDYEFEKPIDYADFCRDVNRLMQIKSERHACLFNGTVEEAFVIGYGRLVTKFSINFKKRTNVYLEVEDLVQESLTSLLYSIYLFDPRISKLTTYINNCLCKISNNWILQYNKVHRFSTKVAILLRNYNQFKKLHPDKSDDEIYQELGYDLQEINSLKSFNGSVISIYEESVNEPSSEYLQDIDEENYLSDLFERAGLTQDEKNLITYKLNNEKGWMKELADQQNCGTANISRKFVVAKQKLKAVLN